MKIKKFLKFLIFKKNVRKNKIVVLGPVVRDIITFNGKTHKSMGGIPYYVFHTINNLGGNIKSIVTCSSKDVNWVKKYLPDSIILEKEGTYIFRNDYITENKRNQSITYYNNKILYNDIQSILNNYDTIIIGPLFYNDIDITIFEKFKEKNIILGNFGMFSYYKNGKRITKNRNRFIKLLKYLNWLFLDEDEANFVTNKKNIYQSINFLSNYINQFVITRADKGSIIFFHGKIYEIPAYKPKKIADTTGAGDTYLASFIFALDKYKSIKKIGHFASLCATKKIENIGSLSQNFKYISSFLKEKRLF
jgi:sugar/nucleoside kinase (ribokinase family)